MTEKPQNSWKERTQGDGAAFIERLTRLQNRHRLLIHMVEPHGAFFGRDFKTVYEDLAVPAEKIPAMLRQDNAKELSMSLMPSQMAGISMKPYEVAPWEINHYGYLFNFDQNQPHPPRVLRVHDYSLNSGNSTQNKRLNLGYEMSDFDMYYEKLRDPYHHENWQRDVKRAMGGPDGSHYAGEQLTMLGESIVKDPERYSNAQHIANLNEVVACASTQHLEAIVIPNYNHDLRMLRLQAALVALDHEKHGPRLPAVIYHVDGPQQGTFTYVGRQKEELQAVGLQALKELGGELRSLYARCQKAHENPVKLLNEHVFESLGIELKKPADGPDGWMADVEDRLDELKAKAAKSPTPPGARTP